MSRIILSGATGLIGSSLVKRLLHEKHSITVLSRTPEKKSSLLPSEVRFVKWDYRKPGDWKDVLNQSEIVIHLAGANLFNKRWDEEYKKKIIQSREVSTENIVQSISDNTSIKLLITASAIGYYGETDDITVTETGEAGDDFLAYVCKKWEEPSHEADKKGIRRVNMRMAPVFSTKEGYLSKLITPFKLFAGASLGKKSSWLSWIHIDDLIDAYTFVIKENIHGPVNVTSPFPVTMGDLAKTLGKELNRPSFFVVPEFALKIIVGENARYIVYSQKIVPEKLIKSGFQFKYPELKTALKDLIKNKK